MVHDGLGNSRPDKTARTPLPRDTHCAMPRAATPRRSPPLGPLLLLLLHALLPTHAQDAIPNADDSSLNAPAVDANNGTSIILIGSNDTLLDAVNETLADGDHEPIVRKKRTFGDIVFRGLADVLGYSVARKPPEVAFPPPLAPVPGIDLPVQAANPAPAPAPAAATAPCGTPRAAAPPPCRAQKPTPAPPRPRTTPPCPKPRAAPRRKPRPRPSPSPPPPPPPPPPCAQPRANPTTPSPCAPATTPAPRPPPPKADNLETITSNFRLHFNFNRAPAGAASAPAAADAPAEEQEPEQEQEQEEEQELEQIVPVAIEPRAARLPPARARKPRVYVDAFVVRNGVPQKVDTLDAQHLNAQRVPLEDDYLAYDYEELQQPPDDNYEDVQESRDRSEAVSDFSDAVDKFWEPRRQTKKKLPANDYRNVHFGDRELANQIRRRNDDELHQSLKRERSKANKKPLPLPEAEPEEEEAEATTTTEDPKRPLKPRVLPPTEHNPGQIDTVTVRVPPIYKERRPKKLNRERPEHEYPEHRDHYDERDAKNRSTENDEDTDADGEDSAWAVRIERPVKRKRRRKQKREKRSVEKESSAAGDYDYYGNKLPISDEEKHFRGLTVPPPTKYAELARLEKEERSEDGHFLDDHERIREDPERVGDDERSNDEHRSDESERADDSEVTDERERSVEDVERAGDAGRADDSGRADERERTDRLSPNARVQETGYQNNYVRATNVQVDDPRPLVAAVKKKTTKIGKA